jgi:hypothetical protein
MVWIPGWFDGQQWVEGYWVPEQEYQTTNVQSWQPPTGYDDGWDPQTAPVQNDLPLGIPAQ